MLHGINWVRSVRFGSQHGRAAGGDVGQLKLFFPSSVSSLDEQGQHQLPTQLASKWHVPLNEHLVASLPACAHAVDRCVETSVFQTTYCVVTLC